MKWTSPQKIWIRNFTLIEVLAVAAIVSSIPTNSYQRAKDKATQTECGHNLGQIGQLLRMHVLETGEYPRAAFFPKDAENGEDSIRSILGGPRELWMCPSLPATLTNHGLTFVYNDELSGKSTVKNPHKKWVLIEMSCVAKSAPNPHPGGYNILFADGHVIASKKLPNKITRAQ